MTKSWRHVLTHTCVYKYIHSALNIHSKTCIGYCSQYTTYKHAPTLLWLHDDIRHLNTSHVNVQSKVEMQLTLYKIV